MSMTSDEIRSTFTDFFVERGHKHLPSGSLVPATFDPSVLLTTAGMHPLKPYFQGLEEPPSKRLATCQKCFRSTDIDNVGNTLRHLTFFEMLGNFSIGDYFKEGAVPFAWELSTQGFGFKPEDIWVTVHRGDEHLGLGPDNEAIEEWMKIGVPAERIVLLGSEDNFWQAGPIGPCGPCSELYLDRGPQFGGPDDRPGDDTERFLEFWNLVFMQYDQNPAPGSAGGARTLTPLPAQSIDTGMGLNRMASILQGVESVFETDQFQPLIALGEELSGRTYGEDQATTRALRILADHSRAMTFLIADGVVPSNEERGFVLRRVMRRAIQQGRSIGLEPGFAPQFSERVIELMCNTYSELHEQHDAILKWVAAEEEGFGRTLEQGNKLLEQLIDRAREAGADAISSADAFQLHDTYGFPIDLTRELAEETGLTVDREGFDELMTAQRERGRAATAGETGADARDAVRAFTRDADFTTTFTGYERTEQHTTVGALDSSNGRVVAKLVESPFYATGGGQIADVGSIECEDGGCVARVVDVMRLGDDQAVALEVEAGELKPGERVVARVDRAARHATEANHTATHLLHAALRERLGTHVRQAGSYVGPDKLRFDFTHGSALGAEDVAAVEDRVNELILANQPVRAITTTLDEARGLGAMALFGEKYGDVVRMVEVGDGEWSRELCGGTHVRSTAEIGVFKITGEGSSAANVRRIEAITGPEAIGLLRREDALLRDVAARLRTTPERVSEAVEAREARLKDAEKAAKKGGGVGIDVDALAALAEEIEGATVLTATVEADDDDLLATMDQLKSKLGDAAIVLGAPGDGKVALVAAVPPALIERGVKAGDIVKVAAGVVGGGGGGRDNMARAGGKDPSKLPDAIAAARDAIAAALRG